jgi:hypothetical protein
MRTFLPALLSFSLSFGSILFLTTSAFASNISEDNLQINDILLKRSYTNSARVGDALYLWDNIERARYVDRYLLSAQGEWQFKQRLNVPGMPLSYSSAAAKEIRPQLELTVVGNKAMSHSSQSLNLLDAAGHLLPDPLADNTEYRALFGYKPNSNARAQLVGIANDNVLAWNAESNTLSRWRLNTDNKLELLAKNSINLAPSARLFSNGQHHFLIEHAADGKTRAHRFNLTTLELGNNWEVPANIQTWWVTGLSQLAYVDSMGTTSANIRRLKLGETTSVEPVAGADFASALGLDGQQLYYHNQSGQLCRLDLVSGSSALCQPSPAEITGLRSIQRIGQQLLLLGKNAVFLQLASGELQKLQPGASTTASSFRPGVAVVPQGIVAITDWQLIDDKKNVSRLTPQQGAAAACIGPALHSQLLDKVIHQGNTHKVVAHHQDCTAIHQINGSATGTEVVMNTQSFAHPDMQFLAYNGNESMLIDKQFVVQVKRNGESGIQPLTSSGFKAIDAKATTTAWYLINQNTAGLFDLHYVAAGQLGQQPLNIARQASRYFTASDSHLYWLDINANGKIQIITWLQNNGQFQRQSDVLLPEIYQPQAGNRVQMEIQNDILLLWLETKTTPDHSSLLLFNLKNPAQPVFAGAWTNPLDNRENQHPSSPVALDVQEQNVIVQPFATAEILQIGFQPLLDLSPGIIEQLFVVKEDSNETLKLTLKNADSMQLTLLTKPTKGAASLNGNLLTYQPETNFHGNDSLVLKLSNSGNSYEFPIKLQVTAVNDAPVLQPVAALSVEKGKTVSGQAFATDVDGDALQYRISKNGSGTVTIAADGKFSYQANTAGEDTFVIEVQEPSGAKANLTVTAKVTDEGTTVPPATPDSGKKSGGSLGWWFALLLLCWRQRRYHSH